MRWTVMVPGEPAIKRRPRVFWDKRTQRMRAVTPQATRDDETSIGWLAKAEWRQEPDPTSRFGVDIVFMVSLHKNGNERRFDGDNALKAVLDALNGVVYRDDSQVRDVHYVVGFGTPPYTRIAFWQLP